MSKKEKWVTICPKCGSTDISPESNAVYIDSGLSTSYKQCEHCGHHSLVFPQVPKSKVPKNPKPVSKVKRPLYVQTGWGMGEFKYIIYIGLPLTLLIYLALWPLTQLGAMPLGIRPIRPLGIAFLLIIWLIGLYFLFKNQPKLPARRKSSC